VVVDEEKVEVVAKVKVKAILRRLN